MWEHFRKYPPGRSPYPDVEESKDYNLVLAEIGERTFNDWYDVAPVMDEIFEDIPGAEFIDPSKHRGFYISPFANIWEVKRYGEGLGYTDTRLEALSLAIKLWQADVKAEARRLRRRNSNTKNLGSIVARAARRLFWPSSSSIGS